MYNKKESTLLKKKKFGLAQDFPLAENSEEEAEEPGTALNQEFERYNFRPSAKCVPFVFGTRANFKTRPKYSWLN